MLKHTVPAAAVGNRQRNLSFGLRLRRRRLYRRRLGRTRHFDLGFLLFPFTPDSTASNLPLLSRVGRDKIAPPLSLAVSEPFGLFDPHSAWPDLIYSGSSCWSHSHARRRSLESHNIPCIFCRRHSPHGSDGQPKIWLQKNAQGAFDSILCWSNRWQPGRWPLVEACSSRASSKRYGMAEMLRPFYSPRFNKHFFIF